MLFIVYRLAKIFNLYIPNVGKDEGKREISDISIEL
jgi:hypothetical protein